MVKNIVLDFGHGGLDENGRYTTHGKMHKFNAKEIAYEGVLNRQIGGVLQSYLRSLGPEYNIITTVNADDSRDLSLSYRVKVANKYKASETIFVSIHSNAAGGRGKGFELYTTRGVTKSDALAESIANEIEPFYKSLELKLRYDTRDGDKDKEVDFYVLRKTNCPAVLLECLFFDNYEEFKLLRDPEFQKELAWRIYQGIVKHIQNN
ncbi:MAG: N-acetylmuramoyl-L-alanine amidase [Crocinitomicaceae bacterium]|nr:N-acetylmuramoyl-L-alanine amidase [Crocinitomicaceae bacterium]